MTPLPARSLLAAFRAGSVAAACIAGSAFVHAASADAVATFHAKVEPILKKYCYDCHGDGMEKGNVAFDGFATDAALVSKHSLWLAALKNTRSGLMPPHEDGVARPTEAELATLAQWIKYQAFGIDPANPDPGRVTVRRLNRVEYHNTIRDLMGFDFNAEAEFPPDDTGHGFDNIGDVLTLSPLLLEKYLSAAETIVGKAVPKVSRVIAERVAKGPDFRSETDRTTGQQLNPKQASTVSRTFKVDQDETYQLVVEFEVNGSFDFDPGHCNLICRVDGEEVFKDEVVWIERTTTRREREVKWKAGEHVVSFEVVPLPPIPTPKVTPFVRPTEAAPAAAGAAAVKPAAEATAEKTAAAELVAAAAAAEPAPAVTPPAQKGAPNAAGRAGRAGAAARPTATRLDLRITSVQVRGPLDQKFWVAPETHARFFPKGAAPEEPAARDQYAREVLTSFATKAFRRPVEPAKIDQLVAIAKRVYTQSGQTFEEGVSRAMMGVLASPRFIFRVEEPERAAAKQPFAPVDEYALASRLSYFLWSTMPDEELFKLAERGELRRELKTQVARMLKDSRAQAFVKNFTGQWLQARDVEFVPINVRVALGGAAAPRTREGRIEFGGPFRKTMRTETEMVFDYLIREDRSVLELIDSDYTFLNEELATHYGIPDVTGTQLRLVKLPADSPRGGVLTQGSVLAVTSNPTRTSPVKRGLFILENILGTPPPPPPPNVPDLEEAKKEFDGREPKLAEMLAVHRKNALCSSCHERMDPLGLAMENFNAIGGWRDTDAQQPIDPAGKFSTGETFANIRELKKVIVNQKRMDFYRCLTEKMLTYALGRGVEHYDVHAVDEIANALEREGGKMSVLLSGIINSVPFQKQRTSTGALALSADENRAATNVSQ